MNNTIKSAVYMSILGTSMCLTACNNTNKQEDNTKPTETINTADPIDTEMDSVVSPDTIMPAP